ncbi:MAG: metallophosphoesterase [Bauldia sp.]|uniref:metallophosphoesterase n=1 Tax=Bauldia sp. TaxID=2575872 RepID=UPI001D3CAE94|nr:metallophosphoesterase [Bauldia sp.]MCB1495735.1 metallophosphoesterase [Bauldia sp.]
MAEAAASEAGRAAPDYYFLSDLHLGGDGALQHCDFAAEFIAFLRALEDKGTDSELIIGGDTFGFWELTTVEGIARFDEIVRHHQAIFDQLKATGERIRITVMVGNHDYDLACDPAFAERLARYNLHLDTSISLKRQMLGRTIWIEHGQQADPFNASPDYGNRYALPVGYYITETIVAGTSRHSEFGRGNWLKDIRSVATDQIPDWVVSNYFYREMAWVVRGVISVFLLLITVAAIALVAELARRAGLIDANYILRNPFVRSLGFVGNIFVAIIAVNMMILFFMLVMAIPGAVVLHDIKRTLSRFRLSFGGVESIEGLGSDVYLARARQVFAEHPETAVYLFGHTHDAFLIEEDGRVIANMGTWLKILHRVPVRFGYLPAVYYPSFRLNYFHIAEENGEIAIHYVDRPKTPERELGWLQRILTFGRKPPAPRPIPARTTLSGRS